MTQKEFYNSSAWRYCSRYVLLYYSNNGMVQCSTCGKWYSVTDKLMQCGHMHKSDRHKSVCLDFHNLAPQCYKDNKYFSGKPDIMREWLIRKHGEKAIELLDIKKNNICKLDKYELDLIKTEYKDLFNQLVKIKGNPWKQNGLLMNI